MGFDSPEPRSTMPYSVSMPQTFLMATARPYPQGRARALQVLAGPDPLDRSPTGGLLALGHEHPEEDDALALLAGDLGPVVGVGGVGQVLVLLVLLADRVEEVLGADAAPGACDLPLDGQLLGPAHDVLDHGAGGEVLEVHDFLVAVLVRDLDEAVLL